MSWLMSWRMAIGTEHARDKDDEQPHSSTTSVEEAHTVAASKIAGLDVVVDGVVNVHRDGARNEDDEQPHPSTTSAEEVDTVAASETSGTRVVVDVVEDPTSYRLD